MPCISRFATAILSGETEFALGTIRVNDGGHVMNFKFILKFQSMLKI